MRFHLMCYREEEALRGSAPGPNHSGPSYQRGSQPSPGEGPVLVSTRGRHPLPPLAAHGVVRGFHGSERGSHGHRIQQEILGAGLCCLSPMLKTYCQRPHCALQDGSPEQTQVACPSPLCRRWPLVFPERRRRSALSSTGAMVWGWGW